MFYHSLVELAELAEHLFAELKLQSQTGLSHSEMEYELLNDVVKSPKSVKTRPTAAPKMH